jgi:cell division septum initiation protein DivIVA
MNLHLIDQAVEVTKAAISKSSDSSIPSPEEVAKFLEVVADKLEQLQARIK